MTDCINDLLKVLFVAGIAVLLAGIIMLAVNYMYFSKKNKRAEAARANSELLKADYLDTNASSNRRGRDEDGDFEKEVLKIDFE